MEIKAKLILRKGDNILLALQRSANGIGKYTLVGGQIEEAEYAKDALIRESFEEANIHLSSSNIQLVHVLHKKNKRGNIVTFYFICTHWTGILYNKEPKNFKSIEWHPIYRLPVRTSPTTKHIIKQYLRGKIYSELDRK